MNREFKTAELSETLVGDQRKEQTKVISPADDEITDLNKISVSCSSNTPGDTLLLPQWLLDKKEMIYSKDCVEKHEKLGSGQYGLVFRGRLKQGNAV